ncbi:hypothetical protein [Maritimibacter sp. 55A14]|uniref:IS1096 element passenger TnpR family protein n=1 Tax=Maritimibacter sp. 55A14 TaxID=2174844 RepID=UPI0018EEA52F
MAQGHKQFDIDVLRPGITRVPAKGNTVTNIIELKVTLEYIDPAVTRTLQVPADIGLDRLYLTIQAAPGLDQLASLHVRGTRRDMGAA